MRHFCISGSLAGYLDGVHYDDSIDNQVEACVPVLEFLYNFRGEFLVLRFAKAWVV